MVIPDLRDGPVGAKGDQAIIVFEDRFHLGDHLAALTLRLDIIDRPDEGAGYAAEAKVGPEVFGPFLKVPFVHGGEFSLGDDELAVIVIL
jgi:hypothetical protein